MSKSVFFWSKFGWKFFQGKGTPYDFGIFLLIFQKDLKSYEVVRERSENMQPKMWRRKLPWKFWKQSALWKNLFWKFVGTMLFLPRFQGLKCVFHFNILGITFQHLCWNDALPSPLFQGFPRMYFLKTSPENTFENVSFQQHPPGISFQHLCWNDALQSPLFQGFARMYFLKTSPGFTRLGVVLLVTSLKYSSRP